MAESKKGDGTAGLVEKERENRTGRLEPEGQPVAGGPEQGSGSLRYVGGGAQGGQNFSNEGYGANQSYSAGNGYAEAPAAGEDKNRKGEGEGAGAEAQAAVSPEDLGVRDYDLQGGYGKPAQDPPPSGAPRRS